MGAGDRRGIVAGKARREEIGGGVTEGRLILQTAFVGKLQLANLKFQTSSKMRKWKKQ